MPQSWIIEYPLLAYKSYTPNNNELVVMHLAAEMPQRFISLEEWEFVCFVNHTQMQDIRVYNQKHQRSVDIMFLVRGKDGYLRLMSYKTNPWFFVTDLHGKTNKAIYRNDLSQIKIFSGVLKWPTNTGDPIASSKLSDDKIKACQLLTLQKRQGSYQQFTFVIQMNDKIISTRLVSRQDF